MKLYVLEYNCNTPTKQQINVPTNTAYKVGIKVVKNGEVQDIDPADMKLGATSADETKTNGYVTFTKVTGADAYFAQDAVAIDADDLKVEFTLITNVYKSQLGDVSVGGGSGGGVTEQWVQDYVAAETSAFVDDTELGATLEAYPTTSAMTSAIESATSTFVSASDVDAAISTATSTFVNATQVGEAISAATSEFQTGTQVEAAISAATSDFVSATDVEAAISTATSAFVSASDVATAISASLVGYATTSYVDTQIGAVLSQSF